MSAPILRPRSAFVEDLLGVKESEFRKNPDLVAKAWKAPRTLTNLSTGQAFDCGHLSLARIGELREQSLPKRDERAGRLFVLQAKSQPAKLDVGYLQSLPENKNALFQVASNFNALELMNKFDDRAMTELGYYIHDRTQGPFASISAAPGLVLRHYYPFYQEQSPPSSWRQHYDGQQLELLGDTDLAVRNGYVELSPKDFESPLDISKLRVAVHRDIQVTFGAVYGSEHIVVEDPSQKVDQVFTATADLMCTNLELYRQHPGSVQKAIQTVLEAAYEGTLRAAALGGRERVFLTLIGGGVFANPSAWIVQAIEKMAPFVVESGLQVYVNTFRGIADKEAFQSLVSLARGTGGDLQML